MSPSRTCPERPTVLKRRFGRVSITRHSQPDRAMAGPLGHPRHLRPRRSQIIHATLMYSGDLGPVHDMNSR